MFGRCQGAGSKFERYQGNGSMCGRCQGNGSKSEGCQGAGSKSERFQETGSKSERDKVRNCSLRQRSLSHLQHSLESSSTALCIQPAIPLDLQAGRGQEPQNRTNSSGNSSLL
ncbi:hypothetical protein RRG08_065375 [Elysia crispata]|uniref:Uncharacterized protein n=1 Tax=Elysia crispata TaxID=231223 RepID=A0AAE1AGF6_9GAST|nr:hypothetical protein RRG08_065375 [Elysia crispata]